MERTEQGVRAPADGRHAALGADNRGVFGPRVCRLSGVGWERTPRQPPARQRSALPRRGAKRDRGRARTSTWVPERRRYEEGRPPRPKQGRVQTMRPCGGFRVRSRAAVAMAWGRETQGKSGLHLQLGADFGEAGAPSGGKWVPAVGCLVKLVEFSLRLGSAGAFRFVGTRWEVQGWNSFLLTWLPWGQMHRLICGRLWIWPTS